MANITPTVNVTPEEQPKYVTDPELLKQLNSVGTPKSSADGYVTDPELLQQLNAPTQPQQPQVNLQGKFEGPGDTSLADLFVHPIDTLTGRNKVSEQNLSDLVTGQEPSGGSHPFLASAAKGVMNFKSMVNDSYISEILPLIEDHKKQYGENYERATPEQRQDFLNSEAELTKHLNKKAEYEKDIQAVTKKYGMDDFSKKADALYSKPEFQNASTLHQFQMYGDLVLSHPKDIPGHIASVSLESLPTSLTSIVAATMARFMGTGPTGAMMAGGGASGLTEFATEYVDLRQQGLSHEEATMKAGVKSTLIGNMDARSFNSAGKALDRVMGQVDKGIVKRVLSTAKETAKELNKQGMYGLSGEVLGSIASGQKVDPRAALDEYFGELATGPLEALTTYRGKLADERVAAAGNIPPGPPGANVPPGGSGGEPPPISGAISDIEFDEKDIPGAKPTTPTATAEPEKAPEVKQVEPISPELQAKVDEYSELLQKYDPVAYAGMMRDINDGFIKSEDDLKEYKKSYDEIVKIQQKKQEFVNEANEIIGFFKTRNPELAKELITSINDKKITNIGDLSEYRREMNQIQMHQQMMLDKLKKKPIEDKAVEAEAYALVDELEKYNKPFAAGLRSQVENGNVQSMDQLDFAKRKLADYKAQAGEEGKSKLNETYNIQKFYEDSPAQWKNRQKALERATPELKNLYDRTNKALENLTLFFNQNGYSMYDTEASRSNNKIIQQLNEAKSLLLADIQQALIKSERITSQRLKLKPVDSKDISNLELRTLGLEKLISAINDGINGKDIADQLEAASLPNLQKELNKTRQEEQRTKAAQKEAEPEVAAPKTEEKKPIRYDPSTDKYTGDIGLGDMVTDGTDNFIVSRRSGYTLELDKVTPRGESLSPNIRMFGSRSVDPTSPEFRGNLYKVKSAEVPVSKAVVKTEESPEIKAEEKLTEKPNQYISSNFSETEQNQLSKIFDLARIAEKKIKGEDITFNDVTDAFVKRDEENKGDKVKRQSVLDVTQKSITKDAQDHLLKKADELYEKQIGKRPPKNASIKAVKNGSLDISSERWAKDFYDLFNIKKLNAPQKVESVKQEVADQLHKFNAGIYAKPERIHGTKDEELQMSGTPSIKQAEEKNEQNFKIYEEAAKLFLEGPLDAEPAKHPRDRIDTAKFTKDNIQPQSIEKKSSDKVITNYEEQNKVLSEILNQKEIRAFAHGILIDRENNRMVACDGSRATILKKPNFSGVPEFVSDSPEVKLGDPILKPDNKWEDGKYPDIDRIIPESHAENKMEVKAKDLSDYARGLEKANKFLQMHGSFNIFDSTFDAKYIRQMGDLFRKFGYKDIIVSVIDDKKLFATSQDGKLTHIIMAIRNDNPIFKKFGELFKVEKAKGARPDGQTIESIKDRIVREFGRSVKKLFDDGLIVVVNTVNELDPKYQNELDNQDKAFFDKDTGVAYIIADRVSAGDVRKVVLHEVGEHYGLRGMLGEKVYNQQLENLKKQKNRDIAVAKAWDHVLKNYTNLLETDEKQFLREVMAKLGEDAPNHGLWKRFVTAIKSFLVKKGIIKNLTGEELQDLIMRSLHTTIKGRRVVSSGTGIESARGPTDPDAKRDLDDEFRANEVPDAPFNNQKDIADKLKENIGEAKKVIRDVSSAPKQSGIKMISGLDKALTTFRVKNVFFGAGIEETEAKKYAGKLIDAMGKAIASVSLTNAIHAGHIAANVMHLGHLKFNQATQMFQAIRSQFSMDNVFKLERSLFKKLGKQTATNLINTFFEAKRARSIQNEFLDREAELQRAIDDGEDPEVAQRNYEAILKAYKKIPEYFQQKDAQGDLVFTDILDDNGDVIDQIPVLDDAKIDDYIRKDQDFPELKDMMDNWTPVNHNMIDNMVFAGIISKKRGDHLKSIKDYVPWFRIQDDAEELHAPSSFVAGLTNISKERVFRKGAVSERIDNMIDNMVYNVMMMTRNSIRNYGALQIAKAYATRKPNGKIQTFPKEGIMPDGAVRTNILMNGRRVIIEIKDPNHAAALMGIENLELPMLDTLSKFAQGLRRGVTTNPFFQWWQVWKDAPTAAAVTGLKSPLKVWAKILGSFFSALNPNDPIVQTLKSYGIGGFHSSARTAEKEVELSKGQALMNIGPWILKILDHVGDASDYAQRRIIYQETLKQGGTEMEALFRANAVIDFLRHGNSKASLGMVRTVTFMNAYIQQIDVLATSMAGGGFKGVERSKAKRRFWQTTTMLVSLSLLYAMMKGGDDDYDKLDDQTKMRNFIIGNFKIPINTSYGFMFKALPEMIYNYIIKHGTDNAIDETRLRKALAKAAWDSLLGPNPIATALKTPLEIALNHDFFTGGTVTPKGMENLDTYMQYTSSTSNLGKLMSHLTLGLLNPIESDHLMRGLFGTAGSTAGWLSDMFTSDKPERVWARNPIIGQVFLPPEPRGREDLFYDLKERSDVAYTTWDTMMKRHHMKDAKDYFKENKSLIQTHDYIVTAEAGLKELNAEIRRLSDDPRLSSEEKRKRITYYQGKKNNILESVNRERLRAEK